ncbi:MAG: hypothetical protein ALECFALPRED_007644 [Alectoria fallacina]|uniref:Uncharacterized protein n=1 Tax=Alectoria fallacina TaxID=1903189 RepID=A0A8H3ET54_9LECA|nr:MAG: hypothetical protein ALECFALPRED_007644 [Alectoria fallacina]
MSLLLFFSQFLLNLCLGSVSDSWTEPRHAGVEHHRVVQPGIMTRELMKVWPQSVIRELLVSKEGAFGVFSIDPEKRHFCWIPIVITMSDSPQRYGNFGNIHHGSLVRKLLMDTIHEHFILRAAPCVVTYVQIPDISPANVTDILKPQKNSEETAPMLDEEHKAVMLVKESETFSACLLAGTKETGLDHHVLKPVEASSSLGVSFDWKFKISGEERVLPGSR